MDESDSWCFSIQMLVKRRGGDDKEAWKHAPMPESELQSNPFLRRPAWLTPRLIEISGDFS